MKNIKTTLTGIIGGGTLIISAAQAILDAYSKGTFDGKSGLQLICGIAIILLGVWSKDHDGKISQ